MTKPEKLVERLRDNICRFSCNVYADGRLSLIIGMFTVDGYFNYVEIPFSDFAQDFSCVDNFESMVIDRMHVELADISFDNMAS